jgi:hypothetical protein
MRAQHLTNPPPLPSPLPPFPLLPPTQQRQAELTPALRMAAEGDRYYNGIAESKGTRPSSLATRSMLFDSSGVTSSMGASSASSSSSSQNHPSSVGRTQTTFDVHDAVRTPTGLVLPEPSPNHRGAGRAAAKMREDHLRSSISGLTTAPSASEANSFHAGGVPGAPLSTSTVARPDRARVVADQYGAQARDLMIHTRPTTAAGGPLGVGGRSSVAAGRERFWKGEGVAGAIARPTGMDPEPVVGHARPSTAGAAAAAAAHGGRDAESSSSSTFKTTYMAQTTGEVRENSPRRRYYGGAHSSTSLDPNKRTQIY